MVQIELRANGAPKRKYFCLFCVCKEPLALNKKKVVFMNFSLTNYLGSIRGDFEAVIVGESQRLFDRQSRGSYLSDGS